MGNTLLLGKFLVNINNEFLKFKNVFKGFPCCKVAPPTWYTTDFGWYKISNPKLKERQHKSISSWCAKKSVSKPFNFSKVDFLIKNRLLMPRK